MLLAGGVIGPLSGIVIGRLTRSMDDTSVDALTEVCMNGMVAVVITFEGVAPVSYTMGVRARIVFNTDGSIITRGEVMADVLIEALTRTVDGVVSDLGVSDGVAIM